MIIFLYGEDSFRSRLKLKEFKDKFIREVDPDGSSLVTIDGETANLAKIGDATNSASLFCRKRMIVVENILKNKSKIVQDEVADFLKKQEKGQENILIFWDEHSGEKLGKNRLFNFLRKTDEGKFIQTYEPLSNPALATWVKTEVANRGGRIAPQAVTELCALAGNDLWFLNNEIDKLVAYRKGEEISNEDIREMIRGKVDENIFALTDAIAAKNKALTMELIYRELEAGAAETYLLFMILRQFKILLQVKVGIEEGLAGRDLAQYLKLHPFVVQKSSAQVRNFSLELLKRIISKLVEIDSGIKTGREDLLTALNLLFVKI